MHDLSDYLFKAAAGVIAAVLGWNVKTTVGHGREIQALQTWREDAEKRRVEDKERWDRFEEKIDKLLETRGGSHAA